MNSFTQIVSFQELILFFYISRYQSLVIVTSYFSVKRTFYQRPFSFGCKAVICQKSPSTWQLLNHSKLSKCSFLTDFSESNIQILLSHHWFLKLSTDTLFNSLPFAISIVIYFIYCIRTEALLLKHSVTLTKNPDPNAALILYWPWLRSSWKLKRVEIR